MNRGTAIFGKVPGWDAARIQGATVFVLGAGALGNEVLKNLALLGVRRIALMDFDLVAPHNLSRSVLFRPQDAEVPTRKVDAAARTLLEINPDLELLLLNGDVMAGLGLGFLRRMDVAIGCVDNRLARLYLNRLCWRAGIPWVDGGILNLGGQVAVYVPGHSCYECQLGSGEWNEIHARMGCTDMAQRYAAAGEQPTTPLAASIIGAVQVQEALRLLHPETKMAHAGQMFSYEGQHLHAAVYERRPLQPDCLSHGTYAQIHSLEGLTFETPVGEALSMIGEALGLQRPQVELDHPVALALAGMRSKHRHEVLVPRPYLSEAVTARYREEAGEAVGVPRGDLVAHVGQDFPYPDSPLWALGIPCGHVLRVKDGQQRYHVELGGDLTRHDFRPGAHKIPNPFT